MEEKSTLPRIALTMGDPAGIGPEICLHALAEASLRARCVPIVFGDAATLVRVAETCGQPLPELISDDVRQLTDATAPMVLDLGGVAVDAMTPGVVDAASGRAAMAYIEAAIQQALAGSVDAICTAPINKEALHAAGIDFPGHTEIFAERTGAARTCMLMTSDELTCSFVTMHIGYSAVPAALNVERIVDVIELTTKAIRRLQGRDARLIVCGLNPHAGEQGLFGNREEEQVIAPAVAHARERGFNVEGPIAPDTAFLPQRRRDADAFICMYHDQGLIPVKMLAFESAVNITLGLPIVRTSVDHGTAFDIAWQGKADPGSLFKALGMAATLVG